MSYADKLHIPYVAFLGEEEISQGLVKIKDMVTGDQQALSPAQAVETIAAAMAHRAQGKPIREKAEAMRKRKVGAVGLLLIAAVVVIAVVFLRPKVWQPSWGTGFPRKG